MKTHTHNVVEDQGFKPPVGQKKTPAQGRAGNHNKVTPFVTITSAYR